MLNLKTLKKYPVELSLTLSILVAYFLDIQSDSSLLKLIALMGVVYISYSYSKVSSLLSVLLFFILFRYMEGMKVLDTENENNNDNNNDDDNNDIANDFAEPADEGEQQCNGERDEEGNCILDVEEAFRNM